MVHILRKGFTLVETVVALALFATVTAMVLPFFQGSMGYFQMIKDRNSIKNSVDVVLITIENALSDALTAEIFTSVPGFESGYYYMFCENGNFYIKRGNSIEEAVIREQIGKNQFEISFSKYIDGSKGLLVEVKVKDDDGVELYGISKQIILTGLYDFESLEDGSIVVVGGGGSDASVLRFTKPID